MHTLVTIIEPLPYYKASQNHSRTNLPHQMLQVEGLQMLIYLITRDKFNITDTMQITYLIRRLNMQFPNKLIDRTTAKIELQVLCINL